MVQAAIRAMRPDGRRSTAVPIVLARLFSVSIPYAHGSSRKRPIEGVNSVFVRYSSACANCWRSCSNSLFLKAAFTCGSFSFLYRSMLWWT